MDGILPEGVEVIDVTRDHDVIKIRVNRGARALAQAMTKIHNNLIESVSVEGKTVKIKLRRELEPPLREVEDGHKVACHMV